MSTYHATYEFNDGVWLAELAEEPRVHTFGRSLHAARRHLVDATALWFELDPQEVDLRDVLPKQLAHAQKLVDAVTSTRQEAELLGLSASLMTRATVRRLSTETPLSQRDIATLLDMSHQRVQQILKPQPVFQARITVSVTCDSNHDCDALLEQLVATALHELRALVDTPKTRASKVWGRIPLQFSLHAKSAEEAEELACTAIRAAFHTAGAKTPAWEHKIRYDDRPKVVAV